MNGEYTGDLTLEDSDFDFVNRDTRVSSRVPGFVLYELLVNGL